MINITECGPIILNEADLDFLPTGKFDASGVLSPDGVEFELTNETASIPNPSCCSNPRGLCQKCTAAAGVSTGSTQTPRYRGRSMERKQKRVVRRNFDEAAVLPPPN